MVCRKKELGEVFLFICSFFALLSWASFVWIKGGPWAGILSLLASIGYAVVYFKDFWDALNSLCSQKLHKRFDTVHKE